ncbi:type II secretion system F family protein [Candidatus Poriferisocius sp.]|uniref:type II secretion system F family protein n=1 Tax=Candidatus Poriferisocius sp. TaxID=3101276 RepID=UPI003B59A921
MSSVIGALLGAAVGGGLFIAALGWRGVPAVAAERTGAPQSGTTRSTAGRVLSLCLAAGAAVVAMAATGWPVAGVLAAFAGYGAPSVWRAKAGRDREVDRLDALATWVEMLRDTIGAASGLTEAVTATAATAPTPVRNSVRHLAARAEREPFPDALAKFADEVDHAVADAVVVALALAATNQVGSLQESLAELARNTRQEVSMRLRIEASRARQFTSARFIAGVVTVFSVGLVAFSRSYLAPFDPPSGQVALAVVGGFFLASGTALVQMSRFSDPPRILHVRPIPVTSSTARGPR